jgi:hypothetical protein
VNGKNSFVINEPVTFPKNYPALASTKVEHARANLLRGKGSATQKMAMKKGGLMGFQRISWDFNAIS